MDLFVEWLPIILVLLSVGSIAGLLAGLLGVGGGIVIVPALYFILQFLGASLTTSMLVAVGTSLLTIIPTSLSSSRAHYRRGNIDFALLKRWVLPMFVGVLIGGYVAVRLKGAVLTAVFGTFLVLVALNILLRSNANASTAKMPGTTVQSMVASTIGFLSVMMGIGGGALGVVAMTRFGIAVHRAVGTAAVFGLIISLPGAIMLIVNGTTPADTPMGTYGFVNIPGAMVIVSMSILFAPIGVKLGATFDGVVLKRIFAFFLILTGLRMIWQTLTLTV